MSKESSDSESSTFEGVEPQARAYLLLGSVMLADTIGRLLPPDWFFRHVMLGNFVTAVLVVAAFLLAYIGSSKNVTGRLSYLVDRLTDLLVIGLALSASPSLIGNLTEWPMSINSATILAMLISIMYLIFAWFVLFVLKQARDKKR